MHVFKPCSSFVLQIAVALAVGVLSCMYVCCGSWKAAAGSYLDVGGQLLSQLQSEEGAVLTEQLLTEVAVAREALEKADAAYNAALDKLGVWQCQSAADAASQKLLTCSVLYLEIA
jgi:hypothetical protein